jgi:hypothetical protein
MLCWKFSDHVTVATAAKLLASEMNVLTESKHDPSKSNQDSVTSFEDDERHARMTSLNHLEIETDEDLAGATPYQEEPSDPTYYRDRATDVHCQTPRVEPEGASGDEVNNDSLKVLSAEVVCVMPCIDADGDSSAVNWEDDETEIANRTERQVLSELNDILDNETYCDEMVLSSDAAGRHNTSQQVNCVVSQTNASGTTVVYISSQPRFEAINLNDGKRTDTLTVQREKEQICRADDCQFSDDDQRIVLPLPKRKMTTSPADNLANAATSSAQTNVTDASSRLMVSNDNHPVNLSARNESKQHKHDVTGANVYTFRVETGSRDHSSDVSVAAASQRSLQSSDAASAESANNLRQVMLASRRIELVNNTISKPDENSDADDVILPLPKRIGGETSGSKLDKNEALFEEQNVRVSCVETCERVASVRHQVPAFDDRDKSAKQTADCISDDEGDNELHATLIDIPSPKLLAHKFVVETDLPLRSSSPAVLHPAGNSQRRASPICDIVVTSARDVDASSQCSDEKPHSQKADDSFTDVIQKHVDSFLDAFIPNESNYAESSNNEDSEYDANDVSHDYSSIEEDMFDESSHQNKFYFNLTGSLRTSSGSTGKRDGHEEHHDIRSCQLDNVSLPGTDDTEELTCHITDSGRRSASPDSSEVSTIAVTTIRSQNSSSGLDQNRATPQLSSTLPSDFSVQKLPTQKASIAIGADSPPVISRLTRSNHNSEDQEVQVVSVYIDKSESSKASDSPPVRMSSDSSATINVRDVGRDKLRSETTASETQPRDYIASISVGKSEGGDARKLDTVIDTVKLSAGVDTAIHNQHTGDTHGGLESVTQVYDVHKDNRTLVTVQPTRPVNNSRSSADDTLQRNKPEIGRTSSETAEQSDDNRAISSSVQVFGVTSSDSNAKVLGKTTGSPRIVQKTVKAQSVPVTQSERQSPLVSRRGNSHDKVASLTPGESPMSRAVMSATARPMVTSAADGVNRRRTRGTGLQFLRQPKQVVLVEMNKSSQPLSHVSRDAVERSIADDVAQVGDACMTNVTNVSSATSTPSSSVQLSRRQTYVDTKRPSHGSIADATDNLDPEEFSATLLKLRASLKSSQSRTSTVSTRFAANGTDLVTVRTKVPSAE